MMILDDCRTNKMPRIYLRREQRAISSGRLVLEHDVSKFRNAPVFSPYGIMTYGTKKLHALRMFN